MVSRSKKMTSLLDANVKQVATRESEVNLSKLIEHFSRSRNNKELYELVHKAVTGMAKFLKERAKRQNPDREETSLFVYTEYLINSWAHMKYDDRRDMPHFGMCDAQERRRLNPIIHQYLYDHMNTPRFQYGTPFGFPSYQE